MTMTEAPDEPPTPLEVLKDKNIISQIHKRKIANNITQGEAKNVKKILNMPESVSGFIEIFGEEDAKKYLKALNTITDIAGYFDWVIPFEQQLSMWKRRDRFAGSVKVDWEPEKKKEDSEDVEDYWKKILDDLEKSSEIPADASEAIEGTNPRISSRGTDYAMLLHETVKGIYELIVMSSYPSEFEATPEDREMMETVFMNTDTLADEIEDLKYGPKIAADLRDFLNSYPGSNSVENFREKVFGKMIVMEANEFLEIMRLILSGDPLAKKKINELAEEVINEDREWKKSMATGDYERPEAATASKRSESDIMKDIDAALDAKDFEKVKKLSAELKALESLSLESVEKLKLLEKNYNI